MSCTASAGWSRGAACGGTGPNREADEPARPADERRAAPRFACGQDRPGHLIVAGGADPRWARPRDVSVCGIGLLLAQPFAPGTTLTIQLRSRPEDARRPLTAGVVRTEPQADGSWLVGCAFDKPLTAEELRAFL
jgi:PilZ domain